MCFYLYVCVIEEVSTHIFAVPTPISFEIKYVYTKQNRTCKSVLDACCICEETGEPGKIDPKTEECMCECYCDPEKTIKSLKVRLCLQLSAIMLD